MIKSETRDCRGATQWPPLMRISSTSRDWVTGFSSHRDTSPPERAATECRPYRLAIARLSLVALILSIAAALASAQTTQCSLKLADLPNSPELMGFKIGMSKDDAKARVPQVIFGKTDDFGVAKTSINPDFDPRINKASFPGVRTVSLDFLDSHLYSLWIGYDSTFKWSNVPDFVKGISAALHLPDSWSTWKTRGQRLRCSDFQMTVINVAEGPSFRILDDKAEQLIAERRAAREEENSAEEAEKLEEVVADKQLKVFYPRGCQLAIKIADANRVVFESQEAAQQAGYKVIRNCSTQP